MPYLVQGWTDEDESASNHWSNTECHSCEVKRTRYVTFPTRYNVCSLLTVYSDGHACLVETAESKRRNKPDRSTETVMEFASL